MNSILSRAGRRRGWRLRTAAGECRVIRPADLAEGETPERSGLVSLQVAAWVRDPLARPLLAEMCEAAFGARVAPHMLTDASRLADKLEAAFRQGRLMVVREEGRAAGAAAGGGGAPAQSGQQAGVASRRGGSSADGTQSSAAEAPPPPPPKKSEKTWFRAQLLDEDGKPMAGEDYILIDSTGAKRQGKLDADGQVYVPAILPPGDCVLRFPNVHQNPRKRKS